MSKHKDYSNGNEGIQANQVSAEVLAVGNHAHATKNVTHAASHAELEHQITQLERALAELVQDKQQLARLSEDLAALRATVDEPDKSQTSRASLLEHFVAKLKMTSVVLKETAAIVGPLTTIAKLLGIPLKLLGIG